MSTTKKVLRLYASKKWHIAALCALVPVIAQLNIQAQTILGAVVDSITGIDAFAPLMMQYALIVTAQFLAQQGYSIVENILSFQVIYDLRMAIAEKVLKIKTIALQNHLPADILQMWNSDTKELQNLSINTIFGFLISAASGLLAMIKLWQLSIYFPIAAILINLITTLPVHVIGNRNKKAAQALRSSEVRMNGKFYSILNAIRLVKSFGKEQEEVNRFETFNDAYIDSKMGSLVATRVYKSLIRTIDSIVPTIVIISASLQVKSGGLTIGDIVMSIALLATVNQPFGEIGNFFVSLKAIGFKFNALFAFLEEDDEPTGGQPIDSGDSNFSLLLQNVALDINDARLVRNINLSIHKGEKIGIVGESGSGKTTLNNLILRLYDPTEGTILLNGTDVLTLSISDYRDRIHYAQSNIYLINDTIERNLTITGASLRDVSAAAQSIGFHQEILAMPGGYDTFIDASAANISGGQKKKIEIIRALASPEKSLYVFDEITRGIDPAAIGTIMDHLLNSIKGAAIFTMHNLDGIERMNKILVMQSGCIIAVGKHHELIETCPYYRTLYSDIHDMHDIERK